MIKFTLKKIKEHLPRTISLDHAKDTGMAMVLICLLIAVIGKKPRFVEIALFLLVVNMIWPRLYRPLAKFWFGFSRLLGAFVSKLLFSLIFIVMVVPMGLVRRLLGKDSLKLKQWKKGRTSVFRVRDHDFMTRDIVHPY